jgi:hypothetical protein
MLQKRPSGGPSMRAGVTKLEGAPSCGLAPLRGVFARVGLLVLPFALLLRVLFFISVHPCESVAERGLLFLFWLTANMPSDSLNNAREKMRMVDLQHSGAEAWAAPLCGVAQWWNAVEPWENV